MVLGGRNMESRMGNNKKMVKIEFVMGIAIVFHPQLSIPAINLCLAMEALDAIWTRGEAEGTVLGSYLGGIWIGRRTAAGVLAWLEGPGYCYWSTPLGDGLGDAIKPTVAYRGRLLASYRPWSTQGRSPGGTIHCRLIRC